METHARMGYDLLKHITDLAGAAEIVLTHHERFDGGGYPQGLKGDEIPLGARVFAVADTLDAITSDRPYRRAQSYGVARAEISRVSGSQLDPAVVSVFLSISEAAWESIRQGTGARLSGLVTKPDAAYAGLADKGLGFSAAIAGT